MKQAEKKNQVAFEELNAHYQRVMSVFYNKDKYFYG